MSGPLLQRFADVMPLLLAGARTAVLIALGAALLAAALGTALALLRSFSRSRGVVLAVAAFTEWQRNVPGVAHLFILYFGLPAIGIRLPAVAAAIVGLGLVGAASVSDILGNTLRALPAGQREAALAAGLTPWQAIRHVLLPQALRLAWPGFGNSACQLLKDTSIASAIAAPEIMFFARNLVTSTFDTTLIYLAVLALYAALLVPLGAGFVWIERRWRRASSAS